MAAFAPVAQRESGLHVLVISSKRHLEGAVDGDGTTLVEVLDKAGIPYHDSEDISSDPILEAEVTATTLGIALGAAWPFGAPAAALFAPGNLLDFMGIPLPQYRGGAHYSWQIMHEAKKGAGNLQIIHGGEASFHKGEIIDSFSYTLPVALHTPADFFTFIVPKEKAFLLKFLHRALSGKTFHPKTIDEGKSSHYPFLSTLEQGYIDWSWHGAHIASFIRAFDEPYAGASTFIGEKRVFLMGVKIMEAEEEYHPFTSGIVIRKDVLGIYVATQGALLLITRVSNEEGVLITDRIALGERLFTPTSVLDVAYAKKAVYKASGLQ